MTNSNYYCCKMMGQAINECKAIHYNDIVDEYGLVLPEDSFSVILIQYCPWCGVKLPESKRLEWFNRLGQLGYDNPLFDTNIPAPYNSSLWWHGSSNVPKTQDLVDQGKSLKLVHDNSDI